MSPIANTFRRLWSEEHGWGRVWTSLGIAIALAGGGLVYQQVTTGSASTANIWIDTNGTGTCARSSSPAAFNDATSCQDMNEAWHAASNGDSVLMKTGAYGPQWLLRESDAKYTTSDVSDVVFQPESGATVSVADLMFGKWWNQCVSVSVTDTTTAVTNVTVRGISDNNSPGGSTGCGQNGGGTNDCEWLVAGQSTWITLDDVDMCNVQVIAANHVTISNSDLGPCTVSALDGPDCYNNKTADDASFVTFDNDTIHDYHTTNASSFHIECLFLGANGSSNNITVQNSRFTNCDIYDIFAQQGGGAGVGVHDVLIQNNFFDTPLDGSGNRTFRAIALSTHGAAFQNWLIRYNSFAPSAGVAPDDDGEGLTYTNVRFYGNVWNSGGCYASVTYRYNLGIGTSPTTCGTGDATTGSTVYVNAAVGSSGDYHLASGTNAAVDMVTPTGGDYDLTTDIDGGSRTAGARDAGADERGSP